MSTTHTTPSGARAQFDDAFGNLVRSWLVADTLRSTGASFGERSRAAAALLEARRVASEARQRLDAVA